MKSQLMLLSVATVLSLGAAEWTIDEPTTLAENMSAGPINVNAELTLPEGKTLTLTSGQNMYLPGSEGLSVTLKVEKGVMSYGNANSKIAIGEKKNSSGFIDVDGNYDFYASYGWIGGNMVVKDGYADIMRIANGQTGGNWYRVYIKSWYNYCRNNNFVRIFFDKPGGTIAFSGTESTYMFDGQSNSGFAFEGINGADITFGIGSWWTTSKEKSLLSPNRASPTKFKTMGQCDAVFHNHNDAEYRAIIINYDTNTFVWAHSGKTIVSNGCVLRTTASYALPNGPQTGIMEFRGKANNTSVRPVIDLMGTTQIVNGIGDTTYRTTGAITNGAAESATLIFGVRNENTSLTVGNLYANVGVRKAGTGSFAITKTVFHGNDLMVEGGVTTISNCGSKVSVGAVSITGGTLVVDGCTLDCTSIETSGTGKIVCRNGGLITGANVKGATVEVEPGCNRWTIEGKDYKDQVAYEQLSGPSGSGELSLVKLGEDCLTYSPKGVAFGGVDVKAGTLRIGGTFYPAQYWRYTFSKTTNNAPVTVRIQDGDKQTPFTFTPALMLGRLHQFGYGTECVNRDISYVGLNLAATDLAAGESTANMATVTSIGFGTGNTGGNLGAAGTLHAVLTSWYNGVGFTNGNFLAENNKLVYTFRQKDGKVGAAGYLFAECVNCDVARPIDWTVEASEDGVTWQTVDVRTNTDAANQGPRDYGHGGVPYLFRADASTWMFKPTGVVKVASGATLDTTEIDDANVSIAKLEADVAAGAGAITKFVPAENGEIRLVNVTGEFGRWTALYDVGSVVDADNLKGWTVYVNGSETKDFDVRVRDGKLCVHRLGGLIMVVR